MKPIFSIAVALLLGVAGPVSAWADDAPPSAAGQFEARLSERFAKADVNGDGKLTIQEARQGMPRVYKHFAEIDVDGKGYVTLQQLQGFLASRAAARAARTGQSAPDAL